MIEDLVSDGIYGANRAEVARTIILRYLQDRKHPTHRG